MCAHHIMIQLHPAFISRHLVVLISPPSPHKQTSLLTLFSGPKGVYLQQVELFTAVTAPSIPPPLINNVAKAALYPTVEFCLQCYLTVINENVFFCFECL